ncbi:YicC/YloC family endoribonuclease [Cytophagaceae bacterium ABcell3]|nr:YicC/YloC family endoribonuclease [Cytophagaceae bacterium ABcell3]
MIKSMTGFGSASSDSEDRLIVVEVKSLNSKFLDTNLRLPKEYADKEIEVRNLLANLLERGKVSLNIEIQQKKDTKPKVAVNRAIVKQYYKDLQETAEELGVSNSDLFRMALGMPKAIETDIEAEDNAEEWKQITDTIRAAIDKCNSYRADEGLSLKEKFGAYIEKIAMLLEQVIAHDPKRIENVRERIQTHMNDYLNNEQIDKNRFEQELIYYIEKLDITEEKIRLKNHLDYFVKTMESDGSGKKLGFIAQEIGREINTIGSKANDANIQKCVVEMKEELEKIKEQVLNIL